MDVGDFRIKLPTSIIVSGSSQSGKSTLVSKILKNQEKIFNNDNRGKPKVILFYNVSQPQYKELISSGAVHMTYHGLPSTDEFEDLVKQNRNSGGTIAYFDDLGGSINSKECKFDFEKLATVFSHHYRYTT